MKREYPGYLRPKEARKLLGGISRQRVQQMIKAGHFEGVWYPSPKVCLIPESEVLNHKPRRIVGSPNGDGRLTEVDDADTLREVVGYKIANDGCAPTATELAHLLGATLTAARKSLARLCRSEEITMGKGRRYICVRGGYQSYQGVSK